MDFKTVLGMGDIILLPHYLLSNYRNALDFYEFYSYSKKKISSNIVKILNLKKITAVYRDVTSGMRWSELLSALG